MNRVQNIWIVDDDKLYTVLLTKTILKLKKQVQIFSFENGEKAVLAFKEQRNRPDIIFLDINMPIMDGWEFLNEYASMKLNGDKKVRIYTVSSSISNADIDKSKTYEDITEYIIKPLKNEKIIEILGA